MYVSQCLHNFLSCNCYIFYQHNIIQQNHSWPRQICIRPSIAVMVIVTCSFWLCLFLQQRCNSFCTDIYTDCNAKKYMQYIMYIMQVVWFGFLFIIIICILHCIFSDECRPEIHSCLSEVCMASMVLCMTINVPYIYSCTKCLIVYALYPLDVVRIILHPSQFSKMTVLHMYIYQCIKNY